MREENIEGTSTSYKVEVTWAGSSDKETFMTAAPEPEQQGAGVVWWSPEETRLDTHVGEAKPVSEGATTVEVFIENHSLVSNPTLHAITLALFYP